MLTGQALLPSPHIESAAAERLKLLLQQLAQPTFWGNKDESPLLVEAAELSSELRAYRAETELAQAMHHFRKGELEQARKKLHNATRLARATGNSKVFLLATIEGARLKLRKAAYAEVLTICSNVLTAKSNGYPEIEIEALLIKASALEGLSQMDEALKTAQEALFKSREANYEPGEARALNVLGEICDEKGDYEAGLQHQEKALKLWQKAGNRAGMATTHNITGNLLWKQSRHPEALKSHLSALKLRQELGDSYSMGGSYNNIANIYSNLGNYTEALKYYGLALQLFEITGHKAGESAANFGIGVAYHELGKHEEALTWHLRALKIRESVGAQHAVAQSYNYIGNIYSAQGKYEEALKYQLHGLQLAVKLGCPRYLGNSFSSVGRSYLALQKYDEAKTHLQKALQTATGIGEKFIVREALSSLIKLHRATGEFEPALGYYEQYTRVHDEIAGMQTQTALGKLRHDYDLDRKEKELETEHLLNVELKRENDRSENLLLNILPAGISEELKEKGKSEARLFDPVTILFTDFVGFTALSELLTPQQLVDELHTCFSAFDEIISRYKIEKIKTMGDGFIAASGLPSPNPQHASDVLNAALEICNFMKNRLAEAQKLNQKTFEIRIGVHTGPVIAGIVGTKKLAYDVWGDTVNTAARMQQCSEVGMVNISASTYQLVKDRFNCACRGEIEAKNKGKLKMYYVVG